MSISKVTTRHQITQIEQPERIADYCGRTIKKLGSKSAAKKAIAAGKLFLNGTAAKTADFVQSGDVIELRGRLHRQVKKMEISIPIVFEDDGMVIVHKPAGLAVNGNRYKTVENVLAHHPMPNQITDVLERPIAVHRLDVPTAGLVILAKTKSTQIKLNRLFQHRGIEKSYLAVVHGCPKDQTGEISIPIKGKKSITNFEVVRSVPSTLFGHLSLLALTPITGRTHQLRIHLKESGHLIVGDKMYANGQKTILGKGLFLFAHRLKFNHPDTGKSLNIIIDHPGKYDRLLNREENRLK